MREALRRIGLMARLSSVLLVLGGCGGSEKTGGAAPGADSPGRSPQAAASAPRDGPVGSVHAFLEGARLGDDEKVATMLTAVARRELAKKGLSVAPSCSDTAQFVVGEVRYAAVDVAHVASRWTDVNPKTGQPQSSDMTWVLRREEGQWRVGGMALTVFEGEQPLLLNFEDPDDMLRQGQMLNAEIARRAQQTSAAPAMADKPGAPVPR